MIIGIDASRANAAEKTGTEFYSWHLIQALVPLLPEHRIRLYSREPLEPALATAGPQVESRVLAWPPGILWSHLRLSWELFWHRPDVLFVPADTVPLIHPVRTVTTIHDVAFERYPELYRGASVQKKIGWLRPLIHGAVRIFTGGRYSASEVDYHRWSVRQALRASPRIITISEFSKKEILDLFSINAQRIAVIYLGVKQPAEYQAVSAAETALALKTVNVTQQFFLFIGRLEKKKNVDGLLKAYRQYHASTPNPIDLVLLGPAGYGWETIKSSLIDQTIETSVHVLGWQSLAIRNALQKSARALVLVSHYEGFGFPPLESLSAGVPVVASRSGSLPEVLGEWAVYAPADDIDKIAQALDLINTDENLRAKLIAGGLQHVQKFRWSATASQTLPVLTNWGSA